MLKIYQFKWCIRLILILLTSTFLLRQSAILRFEVWQIAVYVGYVSAMISTSWLIHSYFVRNRVGGLNVSLKHVLSNFLATISVVGLYYFFITVFPMIDLMDDRHFDSELQRFVAHLFSSFFVSVITYIVLNNLNTNDTLQKTMLENEQLKQAHLHAQLLSLQQQVSPHFLFNSLSTLKTISHDQGAKDYIVQLAKVYRHLLNFNEHHLTTLRDELAFLKSYLYILNLRFEDSLSVTMRIDDRLLDYSIPPLSLQLLVENAIKHNVTSPERPLSISIFTNEDSLIIENNAAPKQSETDGTGMGLQNINDRYQLLVHQPITIFSDQHKFAVTLPLLSL